MAKIKNDRFGNPFQLLTGFRVKNKDGEELEGFSVAYFEQGGAKFKIEISPCNKEEKTEKANMWVKVTKLKKQPKASW